MSEELLFFFVLFLLYRIGDEILHVSRDNKGMMTSDNDSLDVWERVINKSHITVWRKPVPNSYLYEYKGRSHSNAVVVSKF
jgi:hypothetical protein